MKEVFLEILAFLGFSEGTKIANEILGLVADGNIQQAINNIANLGNKISNSRVNEALLRLQQVPQIRSAGLQQYVREAQKDLEKNYKDQVDLQSDIATLNANVQTQMNDYANQSGIKRLFELTGDKEKELIRKYGSKINALNNNKDNKTIDTSIKIEDRVESPLEILKGYDSKPIKV